MDAKAIHAEAINYIVGKIHECIEEDKLLFRTSYCLGEVDVSVCDEVGDVFRGMGFGISVTEDELGYDMEVRW